MPKFKIEHPTTLGLDDSYSKIRGFLDNDHDLRKLDPKLTCTYDDAQKKIKATGSQFKAEISVNSKGSGSLVAVEVDLPLLLSPFKGKVQEMLARKLAKALG